MPEISSVPRTKKVTTSSTEEIPVDQNEGRGLGMPWQDYLAGLSADELAIHNIYIYRKEPGPVSGFIAKVHEAIDVQWLQDRFGGGVYDLTINSKSGKSHYERGVRIVGEPKNMPTANPAPAAAPAGNDPAMTRVLEMLERLTDRLTAQQGGGAQNLAANSAALDIVADAAKRATTIIGGTASAGGGGLSARLEQILIERLLKPEETLVEQIEKLKAMKDLIAPAAASGNLVEQLAGLQKVGEMLGWKMEAGGGGGGNSLRELAALALEKGPEILDRLGSVVTASARANAEAQRVAMAYRQAGVRPPPYPPPAAQPGIPAQTSAPAPPAAGQSAPGNGFRMAPMDPPAGEAPPPADSPFVQTPQFAAFVKLRIVEMVEGDYEGSSIVDWLDGNYQQEYVNMIEKYSPEQVTAALRQDPVLAQAANHPRWPAVLQQARKYLQVDDVIGPIQ